MSVFFNLPLISKCPVQRIAYPQGEGCYTATQGEGCYILAFYMSIPR